jgi:hypothetical protein
VALGAFGYWLRVLRWKSGIGHIGEPEVRAAGGSARTPSLQERETGHRFWLAPSIIVAPGRRAVTKSQWQATQDALTRMQPPPVWIDFLFDGEHRINNRDFTGAVLSLAIALEAIVRTLATQGLSTERVEPLIFKLVDRSNLRSILNDFRTLCFWSKEWERVTDFSAFNTLMNDRDRIMHSANTADLDEQKLRKLYAKLRPFAHFASDYLDSIPPVTSVSPE